MILKTVHKKYNKESKEELVITKYFESSFFEERDGDIIDDKGKSVIITNYYQLDEISGLEYNYDIVYAYLMNNEGKTIEKIN